jgi:hypothetical protein
MATGKTLSQLAAEIERQAAAKLDIIAPTQALNVEVVEDGDARPDVAIRIGDHGVMPATALAHEQIADRVGIPKKYYDRMRLSAPHLLAENVNHWFRNDPEKRLVRMLDGNVRAFLSDRYRPLDNEQLVETVLPVLHEIGASRALRFESLEVTETRLYIKVVDESLVANFMPKAAPSDHIWSQGAPIVAGLVIQNSEVGKGAIAVMPAILVKACSNMALVWDYGMRKSHVGRVFESFGEQLSEVFADETRIADDKAFFLKVRDIIRNILSEEVFGKVIERASEAAARKIIGDPVKAIEVVAKKFTLTDGERSSVLRHLVTYGDLSQWGVSQAVTRAAQDVADYDRATDFERFGGDLIMMPAPEWEPIAIAS